MPAEIIINLGAPGPAPSGTAGAAPAALPNLEIGQVVAAQVVGQLAADTFVLSLLGNDLVARSELPLTPGELLQLVVSQIGDSVTLKLLAAGSAPPLTEGPLPASTALHPMAERAVELLEALRVEVTGRNVQLAAAFTTYDIALTRETVAPALAALDATPGPTTPNVEAAAYLIARGLPISPAAIRATAELIYQPEAHADLLRTVHQAVAALAQSDSPAARQAAAELTLLVDPLALSEPVDPERLARLASGAEPADRLQQILARVETLTAQVLAGDDRLVRLNNAIRLAEGRLQARPTEPEADALRVAQSRGAAREVAQALARAGEPVLTQAQAARLNKAELRAVLNFLLTLERQEVDRNDSLRWLRQLHSGVEQMAARHDVLRAATAATQQQEVASLVVELPLSLAGEPASAALRLYYRSGGRQRTDGEVRAALFLTLPHLGSLRADATLAGGVVSVRLVTHDKDAAAALDARRPWLTDAIGRAGFEARVSVKLEAREAPALRETLLDGLQAARGAASIIDTKG